MLIFKANQLGDNVVFLPVVQELRRRFPAWELAVFTSALAAPLYESVIPDPARRFVVPTEQFKRSWRRPAEFLRYWRQAANFSPDACLLAEDQANVAYLLAFLSGGTRRIAMERPFIKVDALATHRLPAQPGEKIALAGWRIAEVLVREAGESNWPAVPPPPDLSHLLSAGLPARPVGKRRVVIHPGASRSYQCWFPDRYVETANRLAADPGLEVLWIEAAANAVAGLSPAVVRARTPTLRDLAQTLHSADLFVCNNSGPMHMANALGRPCVVINGPTSYEWDPPWYAERMLMLRDRSLPCLPCEAIAYPANVCINHADPMACMKFWTVDAIHFHCLGWLDRWSAPANSSPPSRLEARPLDPL